jgi:hypothetical protein
MSTAPHVRPKPAATRIGGKPVPTEPGVVEIDPITASAWLQRNTHNRSIREEGVSALARDMAAGRWQYTGESIKFGADGQLLDGQHRLAAIVRSEATVPMLVVPALPVSAQSVMDTGAKRTAADALDLSGEANGTLLAAAVRLAINYERGGLAGRNTQVTHSEILDWLETHGDIRAAVATSRSLSAIPLPGTMIAFCVWRLRLVDREFADEFFTDLAQMRTEGKGDPRAALLQRLSAAQASRERLTRAAQLSLMFRSWNAVRRGQPVTLLKVAYNGGAVDIPQPI